VKYKLSITSLTSCSGCISSLFSLDIFPQFLERIDIVYFPFLSDNTKIEEHDIALVEGCVSRKQHINQLKNIRKNAKKIYALGTCAAYGGIVSLNKTKNIEAISKYIEIDGIIPGCPPPSNLLGDCLIRIIENKKIILSQKNLCFDCPLRETSPIKLDIKLKSLYLDMNKKVKKNEELNCFLNEGVLCLGPITREGCECICIKEMIPCEGCMGPISKDFTSNIINFLGILDLSEDIKDYEGLFFRFSKPKIKR